MLVGVPKEIKNHEYRVGLTPASVRELTSRGHQVMVQRNAGAAIGLSDDEYVAAGATLVVMDDDTVRLGPGLPAWLRNERINVFCPTPTLLRAMGCRDPERELPELRLVYVGGEALPRDVAERWARGRRFP